jgi:YebC/PmpR family DNA-binding regulatory protein
MSGHSKWNNIKGRKGAQDQKKSRDLFIVAKQIRVAVKAHHDGNPDSNAALRVVLEKARAVNVPKENIQRAINRALGKGEAGESIQDITYEGYGPHGVPFIVVAVTNNVTRTAGEVRAIFTHHGGSLGGPGSAAFMFTRDGEDYVPTMPFPLTDEQLADVQTVYDLLNDNEDVEEVFVGAILPEPDEEDA